MSYTAAVLTISDKGARGERIDTSGPAVCDLLRNEGYEIVQTAVIPDERDLIAAELISCCDVKKIGLVVTTGGTGFSPRDVTPEATLSVIERETPGIPEAMRAESLRINGMQKIYWEKEDEYARIKLYDENGVEIKLNTGKTFIAINMDRLFNFQKLEVYQFSKELVKMVYQFLKRYPQEEKYAGALILIEFWLSKYSPP